MSPENKAFVCENWAEQPSNAKAVQSGNNRQIKPLHATMVRSHYVRVYCPHLTPEWFEDVVEWWADRYFKKYEDRNADDFWFPKESMNDWETATLNKIGLDGAVHFLLKKIWSVAANANQLIVGMQRLLTQQLSQEKQCEEQQHLLELLKQCTECLEDLCTRLNADEHPNPGYSF